MPNRLATELSPYLLQHAENPVDWHPWGEEALQKSVDQDKPIFLSIGYSACHWCHVMEHESFESPRIAQILNDNFISIKVDREERPDLDQLYMNAVMALRGGGGGWPLSVFLTPTREVFFGGTYWPPESRMGMPGFDHVLTRVLDAYRENRDQVSGQSAQITAWLTERSAPEEVKPLNDELLDQAAIALRNAFDFHNGGFGTVPKFPHAMDLSFLLKMWRTRSNDQEPRRDELLDMVQHNLKKMAYGGIFDHLGGGFARYSVDERWLVPHFEKMLYDNGLLATIYFQTYRATGDEFYSMVGRKTVDYLMKYMTSDQGGFFSTEDADSEGEEGKFYVWSKEEIYELLDDETAKRFCEVYNVTEHGNFEGHNILNMTNTYSDLAEKFMMSKSDLRAEMNEARQKLLAIRDKRIRPGLDDKILCSWNSLGIIAMCEGYIALKDQRMLESAENAFQFIWETLRDENGRLIRLWRNGTAKQSAFLDDYSYLIVALYSLYSATMNEKYADRAKSLIELMIEQFADQEAGGFFFTGNDSEQLIARTKDLQDSSVPSGNSMAATGLLKWGRLCGRNEWIDMAVKTMQFASSTMHRAPMATGQMLVALESYLSSSKELVLVLPSDCDEKPIIEKLNEKWLPHVAVICRKVDADWATTDLFDEVLIGKEVVDGKPTLYVCSGFECQSPVVGYDAVMESIEGLT